VRLASFLAINRRGCNVNSPGRRTSILQVGNEHFTDISSATNHFCALVLVNSEKISVVPNS